MNFQRIIGKLQKKIDKNLLDKISSTVSPILNGKSTSTNSTVSDGGKWVK